MKPHDAPRPRTGEQADADLERLRQKAEELQTSEDEPRGSPSLRQEISVYQEELIIQNEALKSAQWALEETRDRFIELYDFAPTGYLTLDHNGVVCECNLTVAAMLGRSKSALTGSTLLGLIDRDYRPTLLRFLRRCRSGHEQQVETTLLMQTPDGPRYMDFVCRVRGGEKVPQVLLASVVDVTERRQLEHQRIQMAEEHAALAIRLLTAREDERQRIARNLHDDLGQQATALRLTLEQLVADPAAGRLRPRLLRLQKALTHLDQSLHRISAGLRPSALDLGVAPAVRQLVNDWEASTGVKASLQLDDIERGWLAAEVEIHIFRILQETLTNVAKHAAATRVEVVLTRLNDGISLTVEDDGRGFDVETARAARSGLGLIGVRERVHLAGGRLEIKKGPQHGTIVSVTIPRTLLPPPRP